MTTVSQQPVALQPGWGRELTSFGVTHKLTSEQTGGSYYLCEAVFAAESGSPLHIHHREAETIYVLEGAIEIRMAEETFLLPAGGVAHLPREIPHALFNPLKTNLKILVYATPGGLELYFNEMEKATQSGSLDQDTFLRISMKYGLEWLE